MTTASRHDAQRPPNAQAGGQGGLLRLVAAFKFSKAALLLLAGLGAFELLHPAAAQRIHEWATLFAMSHNGPVMQRLVALISGLTPHRLEALGVIAFFFAGLFTIEGLGLWFGKRWAEYLTVLATLCLVPLEVFELTRQLSLVRFAALVLNLAVVGYLIYVLRSGRSDSTVSSKTVG